jgi:hypothetical protein
MSSPEGGNPRSGGPEPHDETQQRTRRPLDSSWRGIGMHLAVAYAVAIILTTYLSPPSDLTLLLLGPLIMVAVSALFGFAAVAIVRMNKFVRRRYGPRKVWLFTTWLSLMLSLIDPFLPTAPLRPDRAAPSSDFGHVLPRR